MADTVERLYKLTVDGTAAIRQLDSIAGSTEKINGKFDKMAAGAIKLGTALAAAFAGQQVVGAIQRNIDAMDDLSKAVSKVGIAAEDLQRLRYAADLSGVSAEQLDKAIGKLAIGMSDLKDGTSETSAALRSLGAKSGEGTIDTLKRISDEFKKLPDGAQKTALAINLFGKSVGPDLIPLLNAGGEALQELANEADRFGGVLTGGTLQAAEAFNDNMSRLERTTSGIGKQISAGLLPMLNAITEDLTGAAKAGDGFVDTGNAIGEVLLNVYGFGLKAVATLKAFGVLLGGLAAAAANPTQARSILGMMVDDIDKIGADTNTRLAKLAENFEKVKKSMEGAGDRPTISNAFNVPKIQSATEAAAALEKANRELWKSLIDAAKAQETLDGIMESSTLTLTLKEQKVLDYDRATIALSKSMEEQFTKGQDEALQLQILTEWYENGTEAQKAYAAAQLVATKGAVASTETIIKQQDEIDVLTDGFNGFFENLAKGGADVEDIFKRTIQSIIAELLKLWAKKYILDAFTNAFGGGGGAAAKTGLAFNEGQVLPFARGGVITRPVTFPMALAGEAGPEGILPLKRTASGDLGVQASMNPIEVSITNNMGGEADVSAIQSPRGVEVIINRVRSALTADILRGGNDFSKATEQAFGLSRGSAAAF